MPNVAMRVNGRPVAGEVEGRTLLVDFLREHLGLTGTHVGCDTSQCGACVVHLDGRSVKSCSLLALQAAGLEVTTIESLAEDDALRRRRGPGRALPPRAGRTPASRLYSTLAISSGGGISS